LQLLKEREREDKRRDKGRPFTLNLKEKEKN
jgi:hypothetical protein